MDTGAQRSDSSSAPSHSDASWHKVVRADYGDRASAGTASTAAASSASLEDRTPPAAGAACPDPVSPAAHGFVACRQSDGGTVWRRGDGGASPETALVTAHVACSAQHMLARLAAPAAGESVALPGLRDVRPEDAAAGTYSAAVDAAAPSWLHVGAQRIKFRWRSECSDGGATTVELQSAAASTDGRAHVRMHALTFTVTPVPTAARSSCGGGAVHATCVVTAMVTAQAREGWRAVLGHIVAGGAHPAVAWASAVRRGLQRIAPEVAGSSEAAQHAGGLGAAARRSTPAEAHSRRSSAASLSAAGLEMETQLDRRFYSSPGAASFRVRGANYLQDRVKVASEEQRMALAGVELLALPRAVPHIARHLPALQRARAAFTFVVCFTLPYGGSILHLVMLFASDRAAPRAEDARGAGGHLDPFERNLARFLHDPGCRDGKLKLVPSLREGPWLVRQAVGQKPVILGKRLATEYHAGAAHFEADIDISANRTAAGVTSMVAGAIRGLVFDIGLVLEGQAREELPEVLLGSVRLQRLDLAAAGALEVPPP